MTAVLSREVYEYLLEDSSDRVDWLSDGFGNSWARCSTDCDLEIVRPGKVQCSGVLCNELAGYWPEEDWPEHDDFYEQRGVW